MANFYANDATDCICRGLLTIAPPAMLTRGGESSLCDRGAIESLEGNPMAERKRKYSPSAGRDVENEMRRYKRGTAKSGSGRQRRQGEEPPASDCNRTVEGAQEGQKGSEAGSGARRPALSRPNLAVELLPQGTVSEFSRKAGRAGISSATFERGNAVSIGTILPHHIGRHFAWRIQRFRRRAFLRHRLLWRWRLGVVIIILLILLLMGRI